ncbi:hypothetical protein OF001_U150124 [Pseudomonas sp. OF001]|nr:hypothetical protein OF001_U150124 [Pseudomonas sp. OF001]
MPCASLPQPSSRMTSLYSLGKPKMVTELVYNDERSGVGAPPGTLRVPVPWRQGRNDQAHAEAWAWWLAAGEIRSCACGC